jgi:hypothetical protein
VRWKPRPFDEAVVPSSTLISSQLTPSSTISVSSASRAELHPRACGWRLESAQHGCGLCRGLTGYS